MVKPAVASGTLPVAPVVKPRMTRRDKVKIGLSEHERYGNDVGDAMWREQEHDDLVLATALAVWQVERHSGRGPSDEAVRAMMRWG